MDCTTKEMKVYDTKELDNYNNNKNENSSHPILYAEGATGAGEVGTGSLGGAG